MATLIEKGIRYDVERTRGCNVLVGIDMSSVDDCVEDIVIPEKVKSGQPITVIDLHNTIDVSGGPNYNLHIPDSVETISGCSFNNCRPALNKIYMGKGIKKIESNAFYGTSAEEVYWSDSCNTVPRGCFSKAVVKRFIAGSSLQSINPMAFSDGCVEVIDLTNTIGSEMVLYPERWRSKEIIPPFYGTVDISDSNWDVESDGVIRRVRGGSSGALVNPSGNEFVITGKLSSVRSTFERAIISRGGTVAKTVTSRTDYLIIGDKPGSVKLNAAKKFGTPTISEHELIL